MEELSQSVNFGLWGVVQAQRLAGGKSLKASGRIPAELECFQDHFPGFPVLPGVLAIEVQRQLFNFFIHAGDLPGVKENLVEVRNVKFASFLKPGDPWDFQGEVKTGPGGEKVWKGRLSSGGRLSAACELVFGVSAPAA